MTHPIIRLALAECRTNVTRLLLTAAAIIGGVGFLAGTLVYGDTASAAFYDDLARAARNVDVSVQTGWQGIGRLEPAYLDRVRGVPEVAHVDARRVEQLGLLGADGKLLTNFNRPGVGLSVPGDPTLAVFDLRTGRLPAAAGEVAVDKRTVEEQQFKVGDTVTVIGTDERTTKLTLVGILDFGINKRWSGLSVAVLTPAQLVDLTQSWGYAEIVATARPGVDEEELAAAIRAEIENRGRDVDIITGSELRHDLAVDAAKYVDGFLYVLVAFAIVALVVSGFVIINTFTILGALRARRLALLRCVGATKSQIYGMVLLESGVVGLAASAVGVLASLLMGWVLLTGREAVATEIPDHALVLKPATVAIALITGTVVTVLSALLPAWQASKVSPLGALGQSGTAELAAVRPGRRIIRILVAGGFALFGLALIAVAPPGFIAMPVVFAGGSALGAGVVIIAPLVAGRIVQWVGWLPGKIFGVPARLAATQSGRHPRRTAATAMALMIGVALMSTLTVLVATAQDQSKRELAENFPIDFQVSPIPARIGGPSPTLDPSVLADLRGHPGGEFAAVAAVRTREYVFADSERTDVWSVDQLAGKIRPEVTAGSLDGLAPGSVAIGRNLAASLDLGVGDSFELERSGRVTVVAVYDDGPTGAQVLLDWAQFTSDYGQGDADRALVDLKEGVTLEAGRAAVTAALAAHPLVRIDTQAERRDELSGKFSELMTIFGGLLAVSVLIAMFGISNNLALSVFERTRESSTLRALGLGRAQLRFALLTEAVLVALVGGGVGIVLGGGIGWFAARGLIDTYGHADPVIPWLDFGLYLGLAVVTAIIAALLPARRAARAPIIAGLAAE
ncbi:putative ABC transport system permease protein [Allocatelliglobosispora scoriae]|uniref:Putative ABC transport system permease protein n=1 Tax=Allocatelliglobosispora scoriae TaxID=643052 RepID=A0A841BMU2_9ACTN|nr:ABC transporter permease [Allocatelliglobosispora scoriae]MBB5869584.1 putative ABC transport system permease protein [Allocatelliglobosispora scoriae]